MNRTLALLQILQTQAPKDSPIAGKLQEVINSLSKPTTYSNYRVYPLDPQEAIELLRKWFPEGEANEMNLPIFSTSGVHGSYLTIEDVEKELQDNPGMETTTLTVSVYRPRIVSIGYGNIDVALTDIPFLKKLRASSQKILSTIGNPNKA